MEREKGATTMSCPTCGTSLDMVAQPDGSVAQVACSKCYGQEADGPQGVLDPLPESAYDDDALELEYEEGDDDGEA